MLMVQIAKSSGSRGDEWNGLLKKLWTKKMQLRLKTTGEQRKLKSEGETLRCASIEKITNMEKFGFGQERNSKQHLFMCYIELNAWDLENWGDIRNMLSYVIKILLGSFLCITASVASIEFSWK